MPPAVRLARPGGRLGFRPQQGILPTTQFQCPRQRAHSTRPPSQTFPAREPSDQRRPGVRQSIWVRPMPRGQWPHATRSPFPRLLAHHRCQHRGSSRGSDTPSGPRSRWAHATERPIWRSKPRPREESPRARCRTRARSAGTDLCARIGRACSPPTGHQPETERPNAGRAPCPTRDCGRCSPLRRETHR